MARTKQTARKVLRGSGFNRPNYYNRPQQLYQNTYSYQQNNMFGNYSSYSDEEDEEEIEEEEIKEEKEGQTVNSNISQTNHQKKINLLKNPLNPFHIFKMEKYDQVRKNNPMLTLMEVIEIIAQEWEKAGETVHKEYQTRYEDVKNSKANQYDAMEEEKVEKKSEIQPIETIKTTELQERPPKRPLSAFFHFNYAVRDEYKRNNPEAKMSEIIKMIAEQWKSLDPETKQIYENQAQEGKVKYEQELKAYEEKYGKPQKAKRKLLQTENSDTESEDSIPEEKPKNAKDIGKRPAPPIRALTPFFLYKKETFDEVKFNNPEARIMDITKIIAQKWQCLDQETRQVYEKKYEEDKKRYEQELKDYKDKYGPAPKKRRIVRSKEKDSDSEANSVSE